MGETAAVRRLEREYVWDCPNSHCRIHLSLAVLAGILKHFEEAADAAGLGADLRGLVMGVRKGDEVHVLEFVPSREGLFCPAELTPEAADIGYGHVRQGRHGDGLALELVVDALGSNCLRVQVQRDGRLAGEWSMADASSRQAHSSLAVATLSRSVAAVAAAPLMETLAPEPWAFRGRTFRGRTYGIGSALLVLVIVSAVASYDSPSEALSSDPSRSEVAGVPVPSRLTIDGAAMALSASESKGEVAITWNGKNPSIADARIGVLSITDGDLHNEIPLTRAQLEQNGTAYRPRNGMLIIRLEVYSAKGTPTMDSVVLNTGPAQSIRGRSVTAELLPYEEPLRESPARPVSPAAAAPRTFIAPPVAPRPGNAGPEAILPDAPALGQSLTTDLSQTKAPDILALPPVQALGGAERGAPVAVTVTPPELLRQVRPVVPATLLATIRRRVTIPVRLTVDEQGRVTNAEALAQGGTLANFLGKSSVAAARLWTFRPGRRGDTAVQSQVVVDFKFGPDSK